MDVRSNNITVKAQGFILSEMAAGNIIPKNARLCLIVVSSYKFFIVFHVFEFHV
jgi:hypothetical protein